MLRLPRRSLRWRIVRCCCCKPHTFNTIGLSSGAVRLAEAKYSVCRHRNKTKNRDPMGMCEEFRCMQNIGARMNFYVVHRVVVSKRTLLVCCCCILYSFDNRGRSLECESRGESHESENWNYVFWSIQMEFFDTKWTRYFQLSCSGSLLGCETNQLLFSVSASCSCLHGPPAHKFPLFSRVKSKVFFFFQDGRRTHAVCEALGFLVFCELLSVTR